MEDAKIRAFKGTAPYYARYRPPYPDFLFDYIRDRFLLDGSGRLLDLGCGTGQIAIPLAKYFEEVVAMDSEPGMLEQGKKLAASLGTGNITWSEGSSYDLSEKLGKFRLVTIGKAFHWMGREETLGKLYDIVSPKGGIAVVSEGDWVWNGTRAWQAAVKTVVQKWLGDRRRAGKTSYEEPKERYEDLIRRSAFGSAEIYSHNYQRK